MIAQPKPARYGGSDGVKLVLSDNATDLWLECEVTSPPSAAGRTVYVRVPQPQVVDVLKAARDAARPARSMPMGEVR